MDQQKNDISMLEWAMAIRLVLGAAFIQLMLAEGRFRE